MEGNYFNIWGIMEGNYFLEIEQDISTYDSPRDAAILISDGRQQ